jgi:hypothetical protein
MNSYPPPNQAIAPKTSGLAITSLILGILGFCTAGLAGIGAVICGHMALSQINKSQGRETGGGLAVTGLVTGYLSILLVPIAILAGIAAPVFGAVKERGELTKALGDVKQLGTACKIYAVDHEGNYPKTLEELVPEYLPDDTLLMCRYIDPKNPVPYQYFGGKDTDPYSKVLIASPPVPGKGRVFCYADGSAIAKTKQQLRRDGDSQ